MSKENVWDNDQDKATRSHRPAPAAEKPTASVPNAAVAAAHQLAIQRDSDGPGSGPIDPAITSRIHQALGRGREIRSDQRAGFEEFFGTDLSQVRIHDDAQADALSQDVNANAFTTGSDVFFRRGAYDPGSEAGRKLLAHELAHVVQPSPTSHQNQIVPADHPSERAAHDAADNFVNNQSGVQRDHGAHLTSAGATSTAIQRDVATDLPNPGAGDAIQLTPEQVSAALHYNLNRFANDEEKQTIRDVLGLEPEVDHLVDEDFVQAVADWQAEHNLQVDGKLGSNTVATLVGEFQAESRLDPAMGPRAQRLAIRTRPNERRRNIDVNGHNDLFDAVLNHRDAQLTLVMRINFQFHPGPAGVALTPAQQRTFRRRFISDVDRTWSHMYALKPRGALLPDYLDTYYARIRIVESAANPHYIAHVGNANSIYAPTNPPGPVGAGGPAVDNDAGWLRMGDEDVGMARGMSRADHTAPSRPMRQRTAAHEFGHMLGLPHINCDANTMICYGATAAQRANIMGLGGSVTRGNYLPFLVAMRRLTGHGWRAR